jgi:phenylacetic acid degradation operon negative regulatory protein
MRPLRARSILFDVFGAFVRDLGNWIAVADLVTLMASLDVDEQAVRSSVSRFSRKGLLERVERDGRVGYVLSDAALAILAEGDLRIYDRLAPASGDDGWVLATFSIPEELRAERHQLRTRLTWLGFGNHSAGLWIAPRRALDRAVEMVDDLGLSRYVDLFEARFIAFGEPAELVRRCWDLDALRTAYTEFVAVYTPMLRAWRRRKLELRGEAAFADYMTALHQWRKLPYLDPGLPPELLPDEWEGTAATDLFSELRELLEPVAAAHVREVTARQAA